MVCVSNPLLRSLWEEEPELHLSTARFEAAFVPFPFKKCAFWIALLTTSKHDKATFEKSKATFDRTCHFCSNKVIWIYLGDQSQLPSWRIVSYWPSGFLRAVGEEYVHSAKTDAHRKELRPWAWPVYVSSENCIPMIPIILLRAHCVWGNPFEADTFTFVTFARFNFSFQSVMESRKLCFAYLLAKVRPVSPGLQQSLQQLLQ